MASELIEHSGVVDERTETGKVFVRITSYSACGACKAREACGLAETEVKIVEIATPRAAEFRPGDEVLVGVRRRAGLLSVALAYGGALVVLLAVLTLGIAVGGWSEGVAAAGESAAAAVRTGQHLLHLVDPGVLLDAELPGHEIENHCGEHSQHAECQDRVK